MKAHFVHAAIYKEQVRQKTNKREKKNTRKLNVEAKKRAERDKVSRRGLIYTGIMRKECLQGRTLHR